MKFKMFWLAIFMILAINPASAGWNAYSTIQYVYTHTDESIYVMAGPGQNINPSGCISSYWLRIPATRSNKRELYQMILTAMAAGKQVNFHVYGCEGNYPAVHNAIMAN
ncbi:MAG: hypothetical protein AAF431_17600 [Pseudomonadota bacterium]